MCHVIALTLPGVSTNNMLYYFVSEIVNASTVWIRSVKPFGVDIRIFIDVIGLAAG